MPSDSTTALTGSNTDHRALNLQNSVGLSAVVLAYMISVVMPVEVSVGPIALTPLRILLMIMIVPLTINLFSGRYGKLLLCDYLFFAHMGWATLAVAVNNPTRVVENVGSAAVEFLGGYLIARAFIRTPEQFKALVKILLIVIVASLPFSVAETLSGRAFIPYIIERLPGISSVQQLDIPQRMGFHRVQNVFSHPIHYGLFCSTAFTLVLIGLRGSLSLTNRILGAIAVTFGALMSLSSGALLAIILHVGLIGWAFTFRKLSHKWLLMLAMFVLAYIAIDIMSNRKPLQVFMSYATFNAQTAYYRKIINDWGMINVWANPIFGLGLRDWVRPHYMTLGSVDNFWLLTAMRYGIPGFILLAVGYFSVLIKIGRRNLDFNPNVALLRFAWMVTFCGLSFTLTTVHIWTAMYSFVFFFLGAGLWMADYSDSDDTGDAATNPSSAGPARNELTYRRDLAPQPRNQEAAGPVYTRSAARLANSHKTEDEKQPQPTLYARPAEKRGNAGKRRGDQIKHSRGKPS